MNTAVSIQAEVNALVEADARPAWLRQAYGDPAGFWQAVAGRLSDQAPGIPRSALFQWYSLFDEFGARHAVGGRPAFKTYGTATGYQSTSYADVVSKANDLCTHWGQVRDTPGATVALVLNVGPAFIACLLAAWHCGAAVCCIPPRGPAFVQCSLERLLEATNVAPDTVFVVAGTLAAPWVKDVGEIHKLEWQVRGPAIGAERGKPHRFGAEDVAVHAFSHLSPHRGPPIPLSAEQVYLGALRDGLMVFGLVAGDGVAVPGFCDVQYEPWLLWMCLASGAHLVDVDTLKAGSEDILFDGTIQILGLRRELRDVLLKRKKVPKPRGLRGWFRDIAEDADVVRWMQLSERMASVGVRGMNYFANTAAGGSILYSAWSSQPVRVGVWRAPGLPCQLTEPNGTGMPALADMGMLTPDASVQGAPGVRLGLQQEALGQVIVIDGGDNDIWVGNVGSHREARYLPELDIEETLQRCYPGVIRCAVLVGLPLRRDTSYNRVVLLVYAIPGRGQRLEPATIEKDIEERLGPQSVPDKVEIYDVNPKWQDLKADPLIVDRFACASQYLSGLLWKKQSTNVFTHLSAMVDEARQIREYREKMTTPKTKDQV